MRSEGLAIVAAVALHGAVLLVARGMPPLALLLPPDRAKPTEVTEYEVEKELVAQAREMAPIAPPDQIVPERRRDPVRAPETPAAARNTSQSPSPQVPSTGEPANPPANPPPDGTDKPKWDDLPPDPHGVLGVPGAPGGPPLWSMPGVVPADTGVAAPAPTIAPAPRTVPRDVADGILGEAMAAHDKAIGIDKVVGGSVASAVASAVRSSDVPDVAKATIEIRLGPSGNILGVRVLNSVGGTSDQWNRVVAAARAALMARTLSMVGAEKGATVTVNVMSNLQAPSGSKGGFTGSGASFDVANIGAHSTRNVRTSFNVSAVR